MRKKRLDLHIENVNYVKPDDASIRWQRITHLILQALIGDNDKDSLKNDAETHKKQNKKP